MLGFFKWRKGFKKYIKIKLLSHEILEEITCLKSKKKCILRVEASGCSLNFVQPLKGRRKKNTAMFLKVLNSLPPPDLYEA